MGMNQWCRGRTIGRGSYATVSLATVPASGELFAVKSAELSRAGLLQREQRILSNLNSPHVVSYLGFDVTSEKNGLYYNLFMEYAARGSLSDEIKKQGGRLDEPTIRSYSYQILLGLAYLHSSRIAHCDVKGQNVLIGSDGRAMIADLGCARWVAGDEDGSDDDDGLQLRGTPMFMAPEVARGEEQGIPADIWALGCTVVEMATGHAPWPQVSDPIAALHRIAFSSDVPELPSWISDEGKDFLDNCLRRDPKERWTAEQLLKHPFVASSANCLSNSDSTRTWISPKSTLDQAFWESFSDEYEEEEGNSSNDPSERIQLLVGGGGTVNGPNWTWDDSWMTIRTDGREGEIVPETEEDKVQIPVDEPTSGDSPTNSCVSRSGEFKITGSRGGSSSEEFILSTKQMDTEDDYLLSPLNYYGFINDFTCNNSSLVLQDEGNEKLFYSCKRDVITLGNDNSNPINQTQDILFELLNWCFPLYPVGSLLLSLPFCSFSREVLVEW
ncbi:mitogen-activated protein kinase kinase kinase 18 [Cocos nucifera]|uniref:Mitogen-activated protein kinase kinase kinase 18 n=1 Tax=Cocos nucifera TaxID=13894 RepID=A0A8K0MWL9_COCNU|nr:mitogen-activated protein kinase kinase kinase 18 [Cocos nucifera]